MDAARRTVAEVREREHPDIVIVAVHAGLDGDARENMVREIATEVPGIDAIVFGHSHQQLASLQIGDVLLMQPKNWGISLGRMDFVLDRNETSGWKIVSKSSSLIPVTRDTPADAQIVEIGRPYHELAERYLSTAVAEAPVSLDSSWLAWKIRRSSTRCSRSSFFIRKLTSPSPHRSIHASACLKGR